MRETFPPTLLQKKTNRLRKETGNPNLRSALDTGKAPADLFWFSIVRPCKMLFLSPIVFLLSFYMVCAQFPPSKPPKAPHLLSND